jgi:hypothetical protein
VAGKGLYANIHAKRKRIANGSGERMRKAGSKDAPTAKNFKRSARTAKKTSGYKMIEVLALAGAVTKVAGAISASVKAGRDVSDLLPHFGNLAKLDADIQAAEAGKHKGPLGRLASSEQEGFAIAQAKMKYKEAQAELKSACQLYGPEGMWDLVVKEQAAARKRQQEALEAQARQRDKLFWGRSVTVGVIIFVAGFVGMVYFAQMFA